MTEQGDACEAEKYTSVNKSQSHDFLAEVAYWQGNFEKTLRTSQENFHQKDYNEFLKKIFFLTNTITKLSDKTF